MSTEKKESQAFTPKKLSGTQQTVYSAPIFAAFGFCLGKGQVYIPTVIQEQFLLQDWRMMNMFLAAVSTTHCALWALGRYQPQSFGVIYRKYLEGHGERGAPTVALGASLLGAGMALSGSCPGTVSVQLASGCAYAPYVMGGAMLGSLAFSAIQSKLKPFLQCYRPTHLSVSQHLKLSFGQVALGLAAAEAAVIGLIQIYAPTVPSWSTFSLASAWPQSLSGMIIGLLQIPSFYLLQRPLGASSFFSAWLTPLSKFLPLNCEVAESDAWYKRLSLIFIMAGAYLATMGMPAAPSTLHLVNGLSAELQSFIGGFMILIGSRLAGGCTSGHGMSGFGSLVWKSAFIAVPCMFLSAIATAKLLLN